MCLTCTPHIFPKSENWPNVPIDIEFLHLFQPALMPVPKPTTNKVKESLDKGANTAKITKVPNGILEPPAVKVSNTDPVVPVTGKMLAVLDTLL